MASILKPYVKQFVNGVLQNPITSNNPHLHKAWRDEKGEMHQYPNRRQRRAMGM